MTSPEGDMETSDLHESDILELNVGGKLLSTTRETFTQVSIQRTVLQRRLRLRESDRLKVVVCRLQAQCLPLGLAQYGRSTTNGTSKAASS